MPVNTAPPCPAALIRPATPADADTLMALVLLVDLHRPAEETTAVHAEMHRAFTTDIPGGPLSQGLNHALIAESPDGTPLGAVCCGPAHWNQDNPQIPRGLRGPVMRRISTVHTLAVFPEHRGSGIARALLHRAEHDFRTAGFAALTLRHDRSLESFYRRLGYTSAPRLTLELPGTLGLVTQINRGWRHAIKPIANNAALRLVHGNPVLTGVLPD
ncbi:GNAT family N-acetyltransferase [Kitasatospora sp. NPDC051914]|uniref:GNAT family N-acetyltransferase n=1 Tax=Kitasatospora sp. NPDC051914 TaxID=3154945 RepID=UPI00343BD856